MEDRRQPPQASLLLDPQVGGARADCQQGPA